MNAFYSVGNMQKLYAKLLTVNVPTMCVIQGNAFAGGLFLALCHDFRIMVDHPKVKLCLSEILVGIGLGNLYMQLATSLLDSQTARFLVIGNKVNAKEALRLKVVTALYKDEKHCLELVQ